MPEQRFTFDAVAELYDRARPGYPAALFEDLIALSGIGTAARLLELGCGPGQASVPLAARGLSLLCLEPGAALAHRARARLAAFPRATVAETTFEDWPLEPEAFDVVFAAQSFHWMSPELRCTKAAAALRPGGSLAVFGNTVESEASSVRAALDAVYAARAPGLAGLQAASFYDPDGPARDFDDRCFGPVTWRGYPWSVRYDTAQYLDLLRTHSDHQMLAQDAREHLLQGVADVLEAHGGGVEVFYRAYLYIARRLSAQPTA